MDSNAYRWSVILMGILLDGEGYRQTSNTRDREVAQIGVLMNLGWVLHRIWTIDWWDNRERELKKLVALLEKLKAESRKKHEAEIGSEKEKAAAEAKREAEERALKAELEEEYEDFDVLLYEGGQPHYQYLISIE